MPYPVDYVTAGRPWRDKGLDLAGGLSLTTLGLREWLGLAVYRLLGYTDALFPGPAPV